MKFIKEVAASDIYPVRHVVLRPGKSFETCVFKGDELESTVHFALFSGGKIAGVTSLFASASDLFPEEDQFQLRGMAVLDEFQKRGFGQDLVKYGEEYAQNKSVPLIWFNARIVAVPFYEKLGYEIISGSFDIGDIGKHYVMFKRFP